MPKLLSEIIQSVATKAGIAADNAELKAIVTNAEVMKVAIPDSLAASFEGNIHSLESAESSLRSKLHAEALNGVDAYLMEIAQKEFGLGDEDIKPIKESKKTNERVKLLAAKVAELTEKKAGAAAPDKAKITEQINALNQKIADITKANETAISDLTAKHLDEITSIKQDGSLSSYQYAMEVPVDVNITTAKQFLSRAMARDGVKTVYDKTTGTIKLVKQDGTDYFDPKTNTKINYNDYEKSVLAENKLLKVADPAAGKGGQGGAGRGGSGGSGSGGHGNERNASFLAHMDAEIQSEGGK